MTKVLTYRSRFSQGLGNQKTSRLQGRQGHARWKEKLLKGTLTQLLYARGDA